MSELLEAGAKASTELKNLTLLGGVAFQKGEGGLCSCVAHEPWHLECPVVMLYASLLGRNLNARFDCTVPSKSTREQA